VDFFVDGNLFCTEFFKGPCLRVLKKWYLCKQRRIWRENEFQDFIPLGANVMITILAIFSNSCGKILKPNVMI
jgi:hypothetical protein